MKFNLEEALYSQALMMGQNSGRAGQFAGAFVAIYDAIDRLDKLIAKTEVEQPVAEAKAKASKKDTI